MFESGFRAPSGVQWAVGGGEGAGRLLPVGEQVSHTTNYSTANYTSNRAKPRQKVINQSPNCKSHNPPSSTKAGPYFTGNGWRDV